MSPARSRTRPAAGVDAAHLRSLAEALTAAAPTRGRPPVLVRLVGPAGPGRPRPDDELEVGLADLPAGQHPAGELTGFVAPADWLAIGLLATGRASTLDDDTPPFRVRTVHLVARGGAWASGFVPDGATDTEWSIESGPAGGGRPTGRLDDVLRRALAEATDPPPPDTLGLWTVRWLDRLLGSAAAEPSPRRRHRVLPALVAAHPAAAAFAVDPGAVTVPGLVELGHRLADLRGWSALRAACIDGRWADPEVPPSVARWHDDGSFARALLSTSPELADLRSALGALCAPAVLSVLDDVLWAWGLAEAAGVAGPP